MASDMRKKTRLLLHNPSISSSAMQLDCANVRLRSMKRATTSADFRQETVAHVRTLMGPARNRMFRQESGTEHLG